MTFQYNDLIVRDLQEDVSVLRDRLDKTIKNLNETTDALHQLANLVLEGAESGSKTNEAVLKLTTLNGQQAEQIHALEIEVHQLKEKK